MTGSPPADTTRFAGFDGLRAIAACTVVVFHLANSGARINPHALARYLRLLNVGVPLFFVISGFLLYRPFVSARLAERARPSTRAFYRRRVLRIVPGFWAALTVVIVLGLHDNGFRTWKWAIVNYGILQSYVPTAALPALDLAWTIVTEMSFYLVLPLYAVIVGRGERTAQQQVRRELIALAMLVLVSIAWRSYFAWGTPPQRFHWYASQNDVYLPATADLFAAGMLLAVASSWFALRGPPRWTATRWLAPAAWTVAIGTYVLYVQHVATWVDVHHREVPPARVLHHLMFVTFALAFAVPSAFGAPGAGWIRRFLESTPLRVVALGSFGIYLYHLIVIHYVYEFTGAVRTPFGIAYPHGPNYGFFALLLMTAGATALCAAASYVVVEAPFLRRKHRGSPRGRRPWRTLFSPRPA